MAKKYSEEFAEQIAELEQEISIKTKGMVERLSAWLWFVQWCSSYGKVKPGAGDADFVFGAQQSAEFAFGYDGGMYPETLILYAQENVFYCLKAIGIESMRILNDGLVVKIADMETFNYYMPGISFKITASTALSEKLLNARANCTQSQLVLVQSNYDPILDKVNWDPKDITNAVYPIVR